MMTSVVVFGTTSIAIPARAVPVYRFPLAYAIKNPFGLAAWLLTWLPAFAQF